MPGLATAAGFEDVDVAVNENCPALFPPYASEGQQMRCGMEKGPGARMGFGPRDNVLRFFVAGGGDEAEFDAIWDLAVETQTLISDAIENETYNGARGGAMYLVTGRKPARPRG